VSWEEAAHVMSGSVWPCRLGAELSSSKKAPRMGWRSLGQRNNLPVPAPRLVSRSCVWIWIWLLSWSSLVPVTITIVSLSYTWLHTATSRFSQKLNVLTTLLSHIPSPSAHLLASRFFLQYFLAQRSIFTQSDGSRYDRRQLALSSAGKELRMKS
jgi:hypothetical protein